MKVEKERNGEQFDLDQRFTTSVPQHTGAARILKTYGPDYLLKRDTGLFFP